MKVIFLDIDGVVNSEECLMRGDAHGGILGIDPYLAFTFGKITLALPDVQVVLSSSWRHWPDGRKTIEEKVCPIFDVTPIAAWEPHGTQRGREIKAWLGKHPEVTQYAIIDDDSDMLPEQQPNFFHTSWKKGITEEIAQEIIDHFNNEMRVPAIKASIDLESFKNVVHSQGI